MTWTVTNLVIEVVAGTVGGYIAAAVACEYSPGRFLQSVFGAIGGGISGYFLQVSVAITVNTSGTVHEPGLLEQIVAQSLAGATAGGISMLAVGFIVHGVSTRRLSKPLLDTEYTPFRMSGAVVELELPREKSPAASNNPATALFTKLRQVKEEHADDQTLSNDLSKCSSPTST